MTVRNLEYLFRPTSVAVVFEPDEASRYAEVMLGNLAAGGYAGTVLSVAAKNRSLFGLGFGSHLTLDRLKEAPDLAVVCATLANVPEIITQLGARGTRAVLVGPALRSHLPEREVREAHKAMLDAARPHLIRVLGPGSAGLLLPGHALNASITTVCPKPGKIALIAQSAAIAAAVVERADSRSIGFSLVLHLGASIDIDLADVLDWLASDPDTETILVQFDSIAAGRKFMSAARAAARGKRVFAIHSSKIDTRRRAHSSQRQASNMVYEAALRRAGWVNIDTLDELFATLEARTKVRPLRGERLCILTNGQGFGHVAADALLLAGGRLAALSEATVQQLSAQMQSTASLANPLALPANITAADWSAALTTVLADGQTDAVLTVCSPSPFAPSAEIATAISAVAQQTERNIFTCWMGGTSMLVAENIAAAHGVFSHNSPEKAVAAFLSAVHYERSREQLMQMPPSIADDFTPDQASARATIAEALAAGNELLTPHQTRSLLRTYGIDMLETLHVSSAQAVVHAADTIGYPVDLSLALAAHTTPSDLVAPALRSPEDIRIATRALRNRARRLYAEHRVLGYRLRPASARSGLASLRLKIGDDPIFGPVVFLGMSATDGRPKEALAAALLPLNQVLARDLVERSHCAEEAPPEQREQLIAAMSTALVRLSHLLTDIDEVADIELDPLHLETSGMVALEVHIRVVKRQRKHGYRRFAIRPYPKELERQVDWDGRTLLIRPIRPEDEASFGDFIAALDPADSRMRFFITMKRLPRSQLARFTQIDYDREMALVVIEQDSNGVERSLGEVRAIADPDNAVAEFAIVISSALKGRGLGRLLMQHIIHHCKSCGIGELRGETLSDNTRMQHLARELGFQLTPSTDSTVKLSLPLRAPRKEA